MTDDLRDLSGQQTGQLAKEWVYERTGKRRAYVIPSNPQTELQQVGRMRFKDLCAEFLDLGEDLRAQLYDALGYRWHAKLLGWALGYGALHWNRLAAEFEAFEASEQAFWMNFDAGLDLVNEPGKLFFLASSVVHDAVRYYLGVEPFEKPAAGNAAEIAAAWPREVIMFPVGAIFISVDSTNPSETLGYGTWQAFGAGRVLVGIDPEQVEFDTVLETGGAKTHTLSSAEMPAHTHNQNAHTHTQNAHTHTQNAHSHELNVRENASGFGTNYVARASNTGAVDQAVTQGQAATNQDATATNQDATATNQNTGGGGAHNNLQPYIVVYMWRRTA